MGGCDSSAEEEATHLGRHSEQYTLHACCSYDGSPIFKLTLRGKAKIDPQRVNVTRQLKRKQHIQEGTSNNVPCILVAVRMAGPSSSLPCAGSHNAVRGKSLLLAYYKEIVGLIIICFSDFCNYNVMDMSASFIRSYHTCLFVILVYCLYKLG